MVIWGLPLKDVLASANVLKDFECSRALDADIVWLHRRDGDAEIYYVANRTDAAQDIQARFRVNGRQAELWHTDTGAIEPAGYSIADNRTVVPMHLDPRESVFVVFRQPAAEKSRDLPKRQRTTLATASGPWDISFSPNLGAPRSITLPQLEPWSASADEGVKYFSGSATYSNTIHVSDSWFEPNARILLNLGTVNDLAEVSINGTTAPLLWKPPYEVDATEMLKPGENQLQIKVTNEWTNRQIGDRTLPPEKQILSSPPSPRFGRPPVLGESGLLGPVEIDAVKKP
jgi:hypothetical protein